MEKICRFYPKRQKKRVFYNFFAKKRRKTSRFKKY